MTIEGQRVVAEGEVGSSQGTFGLVLYINSLADAESLDVLLKLGNGNPRVSICALYSMGELKPA